MNKKGGFFGIVVLIILVIALIVVGYLFYESYTGQEDISFNIVKKNNIEDANTPIFNNTINDQYPNGMLFYPNIRFSSKKISYNIDESCPQNRSQDARQGFEILNNETVLSFYEIAKQGDILVTCSEDIPYIDEEHFIAGEGGPNSIIDLKNNMLIINGTILLYEDSECNKPIVAIHEILHVIGFQHSSSKDSIMYNFSNCNQKITSDIVNTIAELYKEPSLPDFVFENISAVKHWKYLDINFLIINKGLKKSPGTKVIIEDVTNSKEIISYDIESMNPGEGSIIGFKNIRISSSSENIKLNVDLDNKIDELDENNNIVELALNPE